MKENGYILVALTNHNFLAAKTIFMEFSYYSIQRKFYFHSEKILLLVRSSVRFAKLILKFRIKSKTLLS